MKNENKRFFKYLLTWFFTSSLTLIISITYAAHLRGYPAFGGEWLLPIIIGAALYVIYHRKEWAQEIMGAYNSEWRDEK